MISVGNLNDNLFSVILFLRSPNPVCSLFSPRNFSTKNKTLNCQDNRNVIKSNIYKYGVGVSFESLLLLNFFLATTFIYDSQT